MVDKCVFYNRHGVEDVYVYYPDSNEFTVYLRVATKPTLIQHHVQNSFTSPRLGIRFDLSGEELQVYHPNGEPFLSFEELKELQEQDAARAVTAEERARGAEARLARMSELGRKARRGAASAEELAELEQLEDGA